MHGVNRKQCSKRSIKLSNIVYKQLELSSNLGTFGDFKNKEKSVWRKVLWYVKVRIFWKIIQYSMHWDKIETLQKFSKGKINFCELLLSHFHF